MHLPKETVLMVKEDAGEQLSVVRTGIRSERRYGRWERIGYGYKDIGWGWIL